MSAQHKVKMIQCNYMVWWHSSKTRLWRWL